METWLIATLVGAGVLVVFVWMWTQGSAQKPVRSKAGHSKSHNMKDAVHAPESQKQTKTQTTKPKKTASDSTPSEHNPAHKKEAPKQPSKTAVAKEVTKKAAKAASKEVKTEVHKEEEEAHSKKGKPVYKQGLISGEEDVDVGLVIGNSNNSSNNNNNSHANNNNTASKKAKKEHQQEKPVKEKEPKAKKEKSKDKQKGSEGAEGWVEVKKRAPVHKHADELEAAVSSFSEEKVQTSEGEAGKADVSSEEDTAAKATDPSSSSASAPSTLAPPPTAPPPTASHRASSPALKRLRTTFTSKSPLQSRIQKPQSRIPTQLSSTTAQPRNKTLSSSPAQPRVNAWGKPYTWHLAYLQEDPSDKEGGRSNPEGDGGDPEAWQQTIQNDFPALPTHQHNHQHQSRHNGGENIATDEHVNLDNDAAKSWAHDEDVGHHEEIHPQQQYHGEEEEEEEYDDEIKRYGLAIDEIRDQVDSDEPFIRS